MMTSTSLHKSVIDTHNHDLNKMKSSLSQRIAARRSVCLSSAPTFSATGDLIDSPNNNNNNNNKPQSKEEPITSSSSKERGLSSNSSSTTTTTTTTSSTGNTPTKKNSDRPSIKPGFRKPKESLTTPTNTNSNSSGGSSNSSFSSTKKTTSSTTSSSSNSSINKSTSSAFIGSSASSSSSNLMDDSIQIKHTAASLAKMKVTSQTISERETRLKSRSVSVSSGSMFIPPRTSTPTNTTPTNTTPTKPSSSKSSTTDSPSSSSNNSSSSTSTSKSSIDDVFARLAAVTKPGIKSRSQSVSAGSQPTNNTTTNTKDSSSSSSSITNKIIPKILRSSKSSTKSISTDKNKEPSPSKPITSTSSTITTTPPVKSILKNSSSSSTLSSSTTLLPNIKDINCNNSSTSTLSKTQSLNPVSPSSTSSTKCTTTNTTTIMTPSIALKLYINELTLAEQSEILDYTQIFFTGSTNKKVKFNPNLPNNGYDNEEGEYRVVDHDHIAYRFEIISNLGQGSFCQVVKVYDHKTTQFVACKILKNQKRFHNQALTEIKILEYLKNNDPHSTANIVHLNNHFYFRNHLCITFELLSMNLFDFLKMNHFQGFNVSLVRRFAAQILTSLKFLSKRNIIHADLKPENILLKSPTKSGIKLIDFGSSCFENEQIFTYIQSRFYRSPEVIFGLRYDKSIDIWSLGCILAELYTGTPLFPGSDETEQLAMIMEVLGTPPKHIIDSIEQSRRSLFFYRDDENNNNNNESNNNNNDSQPYISRSFKNTNTGEVFGVGTKTLGDLIKSSDEGFIDFISQCLKWEPKDRISPEEGIKSHPWIVELNQTI